MSNEITSCQLGLVCRGGGGCAMVQLQVPGSAITETLPPISSSAHPPSTASSPSGYRTWIYPDSIHSSMYRDHIRHVKRWSLQRLHCTCLLEMTNAMTPASLRLSCCSTAWPAVSSCCPHSATWTKQSTIKCPLSSTLKFRALTCCQWMQIVLTCQQCSAPSRWSRKTTWVLPRTLIRWV